MSRGNGRTTDAPTANFTARRDSIIATATRLYARNGYRGTSVTDLCTEENLTRGLLYYYVPGGKIELLQAINARFQLTLMKDWPRIAEAEQDAETSLRELSQSLMRAIFEYLDEVTVFFHEWRNLREDEERWEEYRARRDYLSGIIRKVIERGQADGTFRKVNPTVATHFFGGVHNWAYQWVRRDGALGPDEISAIYCDIFLSGMRAHGK